MVCLKNSVGIKWCGGDSNPSSGFFINSMAGVTIKTMEKLTTEEANTFPQVWSDIQDRAIRRLQLAIIAEFSKRYRILNPQGTFNLEKDIDTGTTTIAAAEYRGIYVDDNYYQTGEEYKLSALQSHYVQTLYFYSPIVQANSVIKVFDYDLNTVLDTLTQDFAIGWNTIQVNKSYSAYKLFIGVDSTNFNSVDKILPSTTERFPVRVRGGKMSIGADTSTLEISNNTFGLSGIFSVRCKYDNIICSNIDLFTTPYSYLCASELMLERISSSRWNFITVDKKQAQELKDHYDVEFEKAIATTCGSIELDMNDVCLDCGESQLKIVETNVC